MVNWAFQSVVSCGLQVELNGNHSPASGASPCHIHADRFNLKRRALSDERSGAFYPAVDCTFTQQIVTSIKQFQKGVSSHRAIG